jgi:hypothetical protein
MGPEAETVSRKGDWTERTEAKAFFLGQVLIYLR